MTLSTRHLRTHRATRRRLSACTLVSTLAALAGLPVVAQAQSATPPWPAKGVTLIVPYGAGGSLDGTARLLAQALAARIGQPVAVENVTGAGGSLGIAKAIAAPRDGHTLLIAGDAPLVPGGPGESHYRHDMLHELAPVVLVNTAPMVIVASNKTPATRFDDWVTWVRGQPGRLNYASSGIGTIPHLAMEMVKRQGRLFLVHIPYRGGAQIANEVAGGQIDAAMLISASALPPVRARLVKPIAVTGDRRLPALPEVPTVAESAGFKGFNVVSWSGIYAPAGTPPELVQRINRELNEVLKQEPVRQRLAEQAVFAQGGTPAEFSAFIARDRAQTAEVLKTVSLKE